MQAVMKRPLFSGSALIVAAIVAAIEWLAERWQKRHDA
jgi:hypothetical protein